MFAESRQNHISHPHKTEHHHSCQCTCHLGSIQGFLYPSLLLLLADKPSYGYELLARLKEVGYEEGLPDAGTVYRVLRRLEFERMVKSEWDTTGSGPAKRVYRITEEGMEMLRLWGTSVAKMKNALERFLQVFNKKFGSY